MCMLSGGGCLALSFTFKPDHLCRSSMQTEDIQVEVDQ